MATRKVKAAPVVDNITKKQAKKAVREVMLSKEDFMNKSPEEFVEPDKINRAALEQIIKDWEKEYKSGEFSIQDVCKTIDCVVEKVVEGKLIVVDNDDFTVV